MPTKQVYGLMSLSKNCLSPKAYLCSVASHSFHARSKQPISQVSRTLILSLLPMISRHALGLWNIYASLPSQSESSSSERPVNSSFMPGTPIKTTASLLKNGNIFSSKKPFFRCKIVIGVDAYKSLKESFVKMQIIRVLVYGYDLLACPPISKTF